MSKEPTSGSSGCRCWRSLAVALIAPVLVLCLLGIYLASPGQWHEGFEADGDATLLLDDANKGFYLTYILEERYREYQAVEMITLGCSAGAGLFGLLGAGILLKRSKKTGGLVDRFGAAAIIGTVGLAGVFFAGEEINWGQTFSRWGQAEFENNPEPGDTAQEEYVAQSLHNQKDGLPIQAMGSAFLAGVLIVLPGVWRAKQQAWRLPMGLYPAVAPWPVVTTAAFAFAIKAVKSIYRSSVGKDQAKLDVFYMGYLEQLNEQKEMLLALAMLLYCAYALGRVLKPRPEVSQVAA